MRGSDEVPKGACMCACQEMHMSKSSCCDQGCKCYEHAWRRSLSPAEVYALLTPLVTPALHSEPVAMSDPRSVAANLRLGPLPLSPYTHAAGTLRHDRMGLFNVCVLMSRQPFSSGSLC
jgi:hypothetical protein